MHFKENFDLNLLLLYNLTVAIVKKFSNFYKSFNFFLNHTLAFVHAQLSKKWVSMSIRNFEVSLKLDDPREMINTECTLSNSFGVPLPTRIQLLRDFAHGKRIYIFYDSGCSLIIKKLRANE